MWNKKTWIVIILLVGLLLMTAAVIAGEGYQLISGRLVPGGGYSQDAAGEYSSRGALGQLESGELMEGGGFSASGGLFPYPAATPEHPMERIYLPLVVKNSG